MLYFGPETTMPLVSAVAAAVGVVLMFWRRVIAWTRAVIGRVFRRAGTRRPEASRAKPAAKGKAAGGH